MEDWLPSSERPAVIARRIGTTFSACGRSGPLARAELLLPYSTALIMPKIGRYMLTTMPPARVPRNTIFARSGSLKRLAGRYFVAVGLSRSTIQSTFRAPRRTDHPGAR